MILPEEDFNTIKLVFLFGAIRDHMYQSPFLIAEIGGNHGGNLSYAIKLTKLAKESGADAVKFQSYTAGKLVNKKISPDRYHHFNKLKLENEQFIELANYCKKIDIEFMTSIWDVDSLEILDPYVKRHKLGSGDLTNYQIIERIIEKQKPLILSTAMSTLDEIKNTVKRINAVDNEFIKSGNLTLLHCVAMYGDPVPEYANLGFMEILKKAFPSVQIGYSDHVEGNSAVLAAIANGAKCIEVHFTDNKQQEFRDHHLSVLPQEMEQIREFANVLPKMYLPITPDIVKEVETPERIREFRRAVYPLRNLPKGKIVEENDFILLRPNEGLDARELDSVIGKRTTHELIALEPIQATDFQLPDS